MNTNQFPVQKSDAKWRAQLSSEQYHVLREAGTEPPFSGIYADHAGKGVYRCAGCGAALFSSESRFSSGCGWPAFDAAVSEGAVTLRPDHSHAMIRTEALCANCGGHLGHIFEDGPTGTGLRYCINSASLKFEER